MDMIRKKYILEIKEAKKETDIIGKLRYSEIFDIPLLVRFQVRDKTCCLWVDNEKE